MSCLICAGFAETIEAQDWEERRCDDCGHYRMSRVLILCLMEQCQIFDLDKMRIWLQQQRSTQAVATVELHEALLML